MKTTKTTKLTGVQKGKAEMSKVKKGANKIMLTLKSNPVMKLKTKKETMCR